MGILLSHIQYAVRSLLKRPGFTAAAVIGEPAAICAGSVSRTFKPEVAPAVGWMRNLSPAVAVPLTTMESPSAWNGLALVPAPVSGTFAPVAAFYGETVVELSVTLPLGTSGS